MGKGHEKVSDFELGYFWWAGKYRVFLVWVFFLVLFVGGGGGGGAGGGNFFLHFCFGRDRKVCGTLDLYFS